MAKRRRFTAQFKAEVVLEALTGPVRKRNCTDGITSATTNCRSGNISRLTMRQPALSPLISTTPPLNSG